MLKKKSVDSFSKGVGSFGFPLDWPPGPGKMMVRPTRSSVQDCNTCRCQHGEEFNQPKEKRKKKREAKTCMY